MSEASPGQRPDRMPVLVVSGFLGAGKTTFLNTLLGSDALVNSLVIVNEFGDTGLDGLFLEESAASTGSGLLVEELTSGCLCCTLQGPLITTLEDLLRARDNGRIKPFDQLIIETTGLADPAPILGAFANHPYLSLRYLVGGIITVVDGAQDITVWDETPEASAQIAVADILAISKSDLVDAPQRLAVDQGLAHRNSHALRQTTDALAQETGWLTALLEQAAPMMVEAHDHSHHHDHDHDHHHHHAYSVALTSRDPLEERVVTMFMELLGMNLPGELLRVKGIAWIKSENGSARDGVPWAVHAAGPLQHPARPISDAMTTKLEPNTSHFVVITRSDQRQRIEDLFKACLKQNRA